MKRALCIWLPQWPLQRLAIARKELKECPVLLYRLHASAGAQVVAYCQRLSSAAVAPWQRDPRRTAGIHPGMPLAEATALAAYTGQLSLSPEPSVRARRTGAESRAGEPPHLEVADPLTDRLALAELADWCQRFSPTVGLEEVLEKDAHPASLLLDVTGLGPLFGDEQTLARRIVRGLRKRGLTARLAIADTPGAAWALAHFAELALGQGDDRVAIISALAVPLIVPEGQTWPALAPLSVEALRLPDETLARLAELGLERIDAIAALPRATLLARFGPVVLERLDRATGAAAEAIAARSVPEEMKFLWPFEHPTPRREMIEFALAELLERACQALARERRGMLRLECRFEHEDHPAERFVIGMYRPSACPRHVGDLVRLKLETLRFTAPVSAIVATVLAFDRLEFHQQEMFAADRSRDDARQLASLVDRLSNRLGSRAVVRPWLLASAQPEFACQYAPLAGLAARRARGRRGGSKIRTRARVRPGDDQNSRDDQHTGGEQTNILPAGDRPCHLERKPRSLAVVSVAPEGPPMQFRLSGQDERVVRVWGPERIETGWWRGRLVRRDYYQVETATGQRYWLFRQLNSGAWFLHGEFA
jgi:protein ImuB